MKFTIKKERINSMLKAAKALHTPWTNTEGRTVQPKFRNPGQCKYNIARSIKKLTEVALEIDADIKELVSPYWEQQREIDVTAQNLSPVIANAFQKEAKEFWNEEVELDLRQVKFSDLLLDENPGVSEEAIAELIDIVIIDDADKVPPPQEKDK